MQQIDVGFFQHGSVHAVHAKAALQQRQVKAFAVEGAKHIKLRQHGLDVFQQKALLGIITHKVLMHQKAVLRQISQSGQKRNRSRAAAEAGGFRIQIENAFRGEAFREHAGLHQLHHVHGNIPRAGDAFQREKLASVPAVVKHRRLRRGGGGLLRRVYRTKLVAQTQGHEISSFSSSLEVDLPSVPISPTGPAQEGQPCSQGQSLTICSAFSSSSRCIP